MSRSVKLAVAAAFGGLLIAVRESDAEAVKDLFRQNGLAAFIEPIGKLAPAAEKTILVKV